MEIATDPPEVISIRGPLVSFHAIIDRTLREVTLIDGGFGRAQIRQLRNRLAESGLCFGDIKTILLTHGHLDHVINVSELKSLSGAKVLAHVDEEPLLNGRFPIRGLAKVGRWLERIGNRVFEGEPLSIDGWFKGGDKLSIGGGLAVVHLPGHTPGHCGFFSEVRNCFFAGDLFANHFGYPQAPPAIFSVNRAQAIESICLADQKIRRDAGVILNHGRDAEPLRNRDDLGRLARRFA